MWGALELVGSRIGSNARALIVPDSVDLGRLFEPLISRAVAGWHLSAPLSFLHLQGSWARGHAGLLVADQ
jgi:hypothetical protein